MVHVNYVNGIMLEICNNVLSWILKNTHLLVSDRFQITTPPHTGFSTVFNTKTCSYVIWKIYYVKS